MEIKTLEIAGFGPALKALRLPFGKECRSKTLCAFGVAEMDEQDKKSWELDLSELNIDVYTQSNTFLHPKDLALMQTLIKRGDEHAKVMRGIIVYAEITAPLYWWNEAETYIAGHQRLCSESTMHIDCKGLSGAELQKAKADISCGKELTKIDFFSYQCLRNMYFQRKGHRLPEWHDTFCKWVESLPLAEELILVTKSK